MAAARMGAAFDKAANVRVAYEFPGLTLKDPESNRRTLLTGGLATLVHLGAVGILLLLATFAPAIQDAIIPVQILNEEPPPPPKKEEEPEPAPAPKALAERRSVEYGHATADHAALLELLDASPARRRRDSGARRDLGDGQRAFALQQVENAPVEAIDAIMGWLFQSSVHSGMIIPQCCIALQ